MLPSPRKPYVNAALAHRQRWRGRVGLMLVASLSVLAGMTDAIGFMASGDFVSFMSGNTTRLAVAISEGDLGLTGRLLLLVATFVVGNALGVVVSRMSRRHALPLLLCIATLLCGAAWLPSSETLPALLEHQMGLKALLVSGVLAGLLGLVSLKIPRRWHLGYMPR